MAIETKMTAKDFLALPETNLPHELINGEEIMSPSPTPKHQMLAGQLFIVLKRLAPAGQIFFAPLDLYLDDENIVQPDLLWIAPANTRISVGAKYLRGAPDLIVEIVFPGTARRDKKDKFRLYEKFAVREYWIADPEEKLLEIWQQQDGRFVRVDIAGPGDGCKSPLLGEVPISEIFPEQSQEQNKD